MKTKILLSLAALFITSVAHAVYFYSDLGTPASYPYVYPSGINNSGDVVGTAYDTAGRPVAFSYSGGSFDIAPSPGPAHSTWGHGINNSGTIVGLCDRNGSVYHAFYAAPGENAVDFDGNFSRNSEAVAINDTNYVVGSASSQAFLGHTSGWMLLLGSTLGADFVATDLNNSFQIVGNRGAWGGLIYNASTGSVSYLGWALGTFNNRAEVINHSGIVAGRRGTHGFVYASGTATIFGSRVSEVNGINRAGDVVGTANDRAFIYRRSSGTFVDLNNEIPASVRATWTLISADGINDSGVICGVSRRLATPADGPAAGMYVYRAYKINPFVIYFPFPLSL